MRLHGIPAMIVSNHESRTTPFEAVYGRPPPPLRRYLPGECKVPAVAEVLESRTVMLARLKENLCIACDRMVRSANRHRRDVNFQVGDKVFLKVRAHRQLSLASGGHHKLSVKFYGPFEITARVGPTAYRLELPPSSRIHPVFHVSLLKRVVGDYPIEAILLESIELPTTAVFEPERVMARRVVQEGGKEVEQLLVKWNVMPEDDARWMDREEFRCQFPWFDLVATALARLTKVKPSVAIVMRHLRKCIHSSLDDANLGEEVVKWNIKIKEVEDAGLILDVMATMLENIPSVSSNHHFCRLSHCSDNSFNAKLIIQKQGFSGVSVSSGASNALELIRSSRSSLCHPPSPLKQMQLTRRRMLSRTISVFSSSAKLKNQRNNKEIPV